MASSVPFSNSNKKMMERAVDMLKMNGNLSIHEVSRALNIPAKVIRRYPDVQSLIDSKITAEIEQTKRASGLNASVRGLRIFAPLLADTFTPELMAEVTIKEILTSCAVLSDASALFSSSKNENEVSSSELLLHCNFCEFRTDAESEMALLQHVLSSHALCCSLCDHVAFSKASYIHHICVNHSQSVQCSALASTEVLQIRGSTKQTSKLESVRSFDGGNKFEKCSKNENSEKIAYVQPCSVQTDLKQYNEIMDNTDELEGFTLIDSKGDNSKDELEGFTLINSKGDNSNANASDSYIQISNITSIAIDNKLDKCISQPLNLNNTSKDECSVSCKEPLNFLDVNNATKHNFPNTPEDVVSIKKELADSESELGKTEKEEDEEESSLMVTFIKEEPECDYETCSFNDKDETTQPETADKCGCSPFQGQTFSSFDTSNLNSNDADCSSKMSPLALVNSQNTKIKPSPQSFEILRSLLKSKVSSKDATEAISIRKGEVSASNLSLREILTVDKHLLTGKEKFYSSYDDWVENVDSTEPDPKSETDEVKRFESLPNDQELEIDFSHKVDLNPMRRVNDKIFKEMKLPKRLKQNQEGKGIGLKNKHEPFQGIILSTSDTSLDPPKQDDKRLDLFLTSNSERPCPEQNNTQSSSFLASNEIEKEQRLKDSNPSSFSSDILLNLLSSKTLAPTASDLFVEDLSSYEEAPSSYEEAPSNYEEAPSNYEDAPGCSKSSPVRHRSGRPIRRSASKFYNASYDESMDVSNAISNATQYFDNYSPKNENSEDSDYSTPSYKRRKKRKLSPRIEKHNNVAQTLVLESEAHKQQIMQCVLPESVDEQSQELLSIKTEPGLEPPNVSSINDTDTNITPGYSHDRVALNYFSNTSHYTIPNNSPNNLVPFRCSVCEFSTTLMIDMHDHFHRNHLKAVPFAHISTGKTVSGETVTASIYFCRGPDLLKKCDFFAADARDIYKHIIQCYKGHLDGIYNDSCRRVDVSSVLAALEYVNKRYLKARVSQGSPHYSEMHLCLQCMYYIGKVPTMVNHAVKKHNMKGVGVLCVSLTCDAHIRCLVCQGYVAFQNWYSHWCRKDTSENMMKRQEIIKKVEARNQRSLKKKGKTSPITDTKKSHPEADMSEIKHLLRKKIAPIEIDSSSEEQLELATEGIMSESKPHQNIEASIQTLPSSSQLGSLSLLSLLGGSSETSDSQAKNLLDSKATNLLRSLLTRDPK